ncbi:hypothetical protein [Pseudotabrizicola sp. L79]|uniref:hypothetical protein n=1 Tax=Pseudotabrizicola sp. L79 TaxID=3118402 RepID=UPI002F951997
MKFKSSAAAFLLVSACVPATPIVSDYNGASVKIQISQLANQDEAKASALSEAQRICARTGKRAEPASTRTVADYTSELLFLCL